MAAPLKTVAGLITTRPWAILAALMALTVFFGLGSTRLADQAGDSAFLPEESDVVHANQRLSEEFPDSAGLTKVSLIFRGDPLTPEGLDHIDRAVAAALSEPSVAERLARTNAVSSPAGILARILSTDDLASVSQEAIDAAVRRIESDPELEEVRVAFQSLVNAEGGDQGVARAVLRLRELGDPDALERAELDARDAAEAVTGPLAVRALSPATTNEETEEATGSSMTILMFVALLVIAALLYAFMRSVTDLALAVVGLGLAIVWALGAQGWIGPNGLGWIGPPNRITTMVPIILIGLCVDYAIQTTGHYREQRGHGHSIRTSARLGLLAVALPLTLAAGTTVVSFLTKLAGPIPATADFGVAAGVGVSAGLIVMLRLVPAATVLIDEFKEAKGWLRYPRPLAGAIPGAGKAIELAGKAVARRPSIFLAAVMVMTVVLGAAASNLETEFDSRDFLPSGGESIEDLETLDAAFGGQTEVVNVLVEAELTETRTVLNLIDFSEAIEDDLRRPTGVATGVRLSLGLLLADWTTDDGTPGDNFDPTLQALAESADDGIRVDPVQVQAILDRVAELDPEGFEQVAVVDPNGPDALIIQFEALTGDQDRTAEMVQDLNGLWFGGREQLTATSGEITALEITSAMADSQTDSIVITMVASLIVLGIFFSLTERRPSLAAIAVGPIVLVLVWVLGTMALLGIPYNVVTALITALSIGIGVDYTIHVIHRFTEEHRKGADIAETVRVTLSTTGAALLGSALTTGLGFAVLAFSPLTPFQQFGFVTAITISYALLASMLVVPPAMVVWAAYQDWQAEARRRELLGADTSPGDGTGTT